MTGDQVPIPHLRSPRLAAGLVTAVLLVGMAWALPGLAEGTAQTATATAPTAQTTLTKLVVKGRAPMTGYARSKYGAAWSDINRNGCDTRNDLLRRDLTGETFKAGTRYCVVMTGLLKDPYTAKRLAFRKSAASAVQIDHVVALADSWQKGAQKWPAAKRLVFANDPLNLLAVDGPTNQKKGAGDAATWLPPNKAYRCAYVARQIAVKAKYGAWVTSAEKAAMGRVLLGCPSYPLPRGGAPLPTTAPIPAVVVGNPGDTKNCGDFSTWAAANTWYQTYVRAYGDVANLDADDDGIVCESLPGAP